MKLIEKLAKEFISEYSSGDRQSAVKTARIILREIEKDEWQFKGLAHNYAVARALYYLLSLEELSLIDEEYRNIVKLAYYCLLKNYSENVDVEISDAKYSDIIGGSELAFVVICENVNFLHQQILVGALNYLPAYAQKHLLDQARLFSGIVKEAIENHYNYSLDENLSKKFRDMVQELYDNIPTDENLKSFKVGCLPVIQSISDEMENLLEFRDRDDW